MDENLQPQGVDFEEKLVLQIGFLMSFYIKMMMKILTFK